MDAIRNQAHRDAPDRTAVSPKLLFPRVSAPYSFNTDRIQHFRLNTDPEPIRIQGIKNFKTHISTFFLLLCVIFALLDPDPDSEYGSGSADLIESGSEILLFFRTIPEMTE